MSRVKSAQPDNNASFADELAHVLKCSNDSAYRRIRGETLLSIEEIAQICLHFKVPFETSSQTDAEAVTFNYFRLDGKEANFKKWLMGLCENVKLVNSVTGGSILYAADDVPIWHHFMNDEFICFKIFYWMKSIMNEPKYANKKFDTDLISKDLVKASKELLAQYNNCESAEIWTEDTLNSTLKQIEYFWESDYFADKAQALRMCDYVEQGLSLLRLKAEKSSKLVGKNETGVENFKLYRSEVMLGNNSILVTLGNSKMAYVSNNTFNFMSTTTAPFVAENERWLQNLVRKSILISGVSEKQRNRFFSILQEKIEIVRASIR